MSKVVLKIVPVTIYGPKQSVSTFALLDDGASVSLISADITDKAGLHGETSVMRATSAWDSGELVCKTEILNVELSNANGIKFNLRARKMRELNLPVQPCNINLNIGEDLSCFNNCNIVECQHVKPTMLIGQDNYNLIAPILCKQFSPSGPFLTKTLLGWCVHGPFYRAPMQAQAQALMVTSDCESPAPPPFASSTGIVGEQHFAPLALAPPAPPRSTPPPSSTPTAAPPPPLLLTTAAVRDESSHQRAAIAAMSVSSPDPQDEDNLYDLVRRSFSLDAIGICAKPRQNSDELRALSILNQSAELINGQWAVNLPWKCNNFCMPDSYPAALRRLYNVDKKMTNNPEYESRYRERMKYLFDNNYARILSDAECREGDTHTWYLPHFGVDNPNKRKLRLVFDAAAKCDNSCLNDYLLQGPDLLNSLYGVMFRFRENAIGVIGDIKDMFLRIKIKIGDQNALRFLWKEKDSNSVSICAMTSLIFGANCSPFVAQFINADKNASRFETEMPEAVKAIKGNQYMDDYIDSFSDKNKCNEIIKQISFIHMQGGFEMRNWLSNDPTALSGLPSTDLNDKAIRFEIDKQPERTLGLLWFPQTDTIGFDLTFKKVPEDILLLKRVPTKREVLRIVMSIFDIHGYLIPFTINGKILMREIWKIKIQWDDILDEKLFTIFCSWLKKIREINRIRIPRWYFRHDSIDESVNATLELHVFCDASPSAYAAVAFWRRKATDGRVTVTFVASKCKVAPVKYTSVPRLELQAAVLASKLANAIKNEHRIKPVLTYYWTDSTTVLYWIRDQCRSYKPFIANRLGEIDELSSSSEWHYVPTDVNIADLGTKYNDYVLSSDSEWFTGPSFLYQPRHSWPECPVTDKNISNEVLEKVNVVSENNFLSDLPVPNPERFSRWLRLLRATAAVLLFIEKCKKTSISHINEELMNRAETLLLRHCQSQSFQNEINCLKSDKVLKRDSRLRTLTPILDENSLIRVEGRIGNVKDVEQLTKYPIILDGRNYITRLIVMHYHVGAAHSYNEMVINDMRQKYWLVGMRPTVRTVARQCLVCRFRKATPEPPRLGDLPGYRLAHHRRPFTMCGVDLFGPIEVTVGRSRARRYGVLFTCLTVRAVHVEVVSSLTTDSMIMALRRMAARRGWPHTLVSDNGTNLRGANTELKKAYQEVVNSQQELQTEALSRGVEWKFIPPASPHMGGAWERLIRSVKTALKVVLKERAPREETLATFLCEVEGMINGRPLTHVSVDPRDPESLTPNHFLLGSASCLPQNGVFDDADLCLRKQWRIAQRLADLFWSRWMKEVLPTLIPRSKWCREGNQLKVGDLVMVVDPASPRNVWPKGTVQTVYPGSDGRVRVVDIRTAAGVTKRPATRVALLLRNEPNEG